MHRYRTALVFSLLVLASAAHASEPPRIVASIPPVHSLVAAVTQGVSDPVLLLRGGASPHAYAMAPSDARALQDADLVVWVGPDLETFLARPLRQDRAGRQVLTLAEQPSIRLLPARTGGAFESDGHDHDHAHDEEQGHKGDGHEEHHGHKDEHSHGEERHGDRGHDSDVADRHDDRAQRTGGQIDAHLWLDPANARAIVAAVAATLISLDPERATIYQDNAARTLARLGDLDAEIERLLTPVRDRPFVVFHDAYQYLERRQGLTVVGSITVAPDRKPGARRLLEIRKRIAATGAVCVFAEPQFRPDVIATVIEGTAARAGIADPLGAELIPGPELYARLMTDLASSLAACLTPAL